MKKITSIILTLMLFLPNIALSSSIEESKGRFNTASTHVSDATLESGKYYYIDQDGYLMLSQAFDYACAFVDDIARVYTGTISFMGYPDEGLWGYIGRDGEYLISPQYEYAYDFNEYDQAVVSQNAKYWIIDKERNNIFSRTYDHIEPYIKNNQYFAYNENPNETDFSKRIQYYLIDPSGLEKPLNCKQPTVYDGCITDYFSNKFALFTSEGDQITDYTYDELGNFTEGIGRYKRDDKYGLISTSGEEITKPVLDQVGFFHNGQAVAYIGGKYCLIDQKGNMLQEYNVDKIRLYDALDYGVFVAFKGDLNNTSDPNNRYFLISPDGKQLTREYKHTIVLAKENIFYELEDGVHYIINQEGHETAIPLECEDIAVYNSNRYFACKGKKYALIDIEGNMITDYIWADISLVNLIDGEWIPARYME